MKVVAETRTNARRAVAEEPAGGVGRTAERPVDDAARLPLADGHRPAHATSKGFRCERCGGTGRVLVLEGYQDGGPVLRRFCLDCAVCDAIADAEQGSQRARIRLSSLVALAGLALGAVGLAGDFLVPERHAGFGWHQGLGVGMGVVMLVVGLLLRTEVVALGGVFLLAASLCADWFGLTSGAGVGWKQQVLLALGGAALVVGVAARHRATVRRVAQGLSDRRPRKPAQPPSSGSPGAEAATSVADVVAPVMQ